jgi:hypothetical protein
MKTRNNIIVLLVMSTVINTAAVWAGQSSSEPVGEKMSFVDNGAIRLGVDLNLGGSVTYLTDADDGTNIINNHDWGRQIQMSFYSGPQPFMPNGKLSRFTKTWTSLKDAGGSPWEHWTATENWAALVNDNDWGLGVFKPDTYSFVGCFFGIPGKGTSKDGPTGYISPVRDEILDHNIAYEYEYVLIVGKLNDIRRYVYEHSQHKSLPDYRFEKDRQHFVYRNATDAGWPIRRELNISLDKNDPQLIGPGGFWQAGDVPKIYIHAACRTQDTRATIFWKTHSEPGFTNNRSVSFQTHPDGKYHIYEIDLSSSPHYKGAIAGLRLDPVSTGKKGRLYENKIHFLGKETGIKLRKSN